ncbi:MgtC/SapB family protein [Aminipila butyrica]|uniref:MgtC/SapB family protein n=1 Tax=Aminipila butyrica TaxID=433296 RepID=A0A858BU44_9FIRM|nr:MgtC/SapB family protein [Aminipila butyrica]QIB69087.1 MgtC/SapB family protein [Aminipila butyrica]
MAEFQLPFYLYDVNLLSITLRLLLAFLLGGIIGLERGTNNHPAGFRTHILVCVGATLAMLTNQYICQNLAPGSDPARLGAQVITGVGFLGVGTIFVTGKHRIKGLTTAAGLWASACLGLALGIGFYSGALISGLLIFISLAVLPKVENYFYQHARVVNLYVEMDSLQNFKDLVATVKEMDITILENHVSSSGPLAGSGGAGFHLSIKLPKNLHFDEISAMMNEFQGMLLLEQL